MSPFATLSLVLFFVKKSVLIEIRVIPTFLLSRSGRTVLPEDPDLLEKEKTLIYRYPWGKRSFIPEDFTAFNPNDIEKYSIIPEETKRYYKETLEKGERPLLWHGIPHFLYKGRIDL
jgi:hypothetical protein